MCCNNNNYYGVHKNHNEGITQLSCTACMSAQSMQSICMQAHVIVPALIRSYTDSQFAMGSIAIVTYYIVRYALIT